MSLKKHGSYLHAQENFHTQNPQKKNTKTQKTQKNTEASQPFACACSFKQGYVARVPCTRGYHVCLRLFERPGAPTSLKIKVNFICIPTIQLPFIFAPVSVPSSFFARRLLTIMPPTLAVRKWFKLFKPELHPNLLPCWCY